jgi:ABC-type nitrate/sulfonate/bicarbonate transport system substrate-binding protein
MPISRVPLEVQLATSTDSGVSTLEDLQGKTVALEPHGMVEPLFLQLLAANELGRDDVNLVHLDRRDLVRHLRSGLVDASLISGLEPGRLEYFGLSPVEKLKTARKTWQSFLIVHADALEQEKIPLTQLARAVFRANHMLQENSEQVAAAANQWLGRNNNQPAGPVIEKIRFPDSQDAWNLMSTAEDNVIGLAMFQQLLLELGEDVPDVTTRDLVNNTILDKLRTEHLDED